MDHMDRPPDDARPDPPPRGLLMLAAVWTLVSLLVAFGTKPPILPLASSFAPAIRTALLAMTAGLVIGWPLLRLTLPSRRWPRRGVMLDLAVILGAIQISVWPMRLAAGWSIERTIAIDACLVGWAFVASAFCLWGSRSDEPRPRTVAMATLLAMLAAPVLVSLTGGAGLSSAIEHPIVVATEPFLAVHRLADPAPRAIGEDERLASMLPLVVGAIAATVSLPFTGPRRRSPVSPNAT
jgi:hypothetical protein